MSKSEEWKTSVINKILQYESPSAGFGRYLARGKPVIIEQAKGVWLKDADGKK